MTMNVDILALGAHLLVTLSTHSLTPSKTFPLHDCKWKLLKRAVPPELDISRPQNAGLDKAISGFPVCSQGLPLRNANLRKVLMPQCLQTPDKGGRGRARMPAGQDPGSLGSRDWRLGLNSEPRARKKSTGGGGGGWGPDVFCTAVPAGCRWCTPTFPLVSRGGNIYLVSQVPVALQWTKRGCSDLVSALALEKITGDNTKGSATGRHARRGWWQRGALPSWLSKGRRLVPTEGTSRSRLESRNSSMCEMVCHRGATGVTCSPALSVSVCPQGLGPRQGIWRGFLCHQGHLTASGVVLGSRGGMWEQGWHWGGRPGVGEAGVVLGIYG